ncbi:hypothetical protein GCM10027570_31870 [Streptomonospora sediminis]
MGLRERKKLATRRTLLHEAIRLAAEFGSEQVTVDDIAAAANVSKRTFFNYFSSKEEAIVGDGPPRPDDEARAVFVGNGPTGDLLEDLRVFLLSSFDSAEAEELRAQLADLRERKRLTQREPHLVPRVMASFAEMEWFIAGSVAERLGDSPDDIRPQVVGGLGSTSMRFAMRRMHHRAHCATGSGQHAPADTAPGAEPDSASADEEIAELRSLVNQAFAELRLTFRAAE